MDRRYRVLQNGRTGEIVGERRRSFWTIALAVPVAAGLAALLLLAPGEPLRR